MLSALLSVFGLVRKAITTAFRILGAQISVPVAVVAIPAMVLAFLWWRSDRRADNLAEKLSAAQADLATARGNIGELQEALAACRSRVAAFKEAADEASRRAKEAEQQAAAAENAARREADRIMLTPLPSPAQDGPSLEECRAVDALLRETLFR